MKWFGRYLQNFILYTCNKKRRSNMENMDTNKSSYCYSEFKIYINLSQVEIAKRWLWGSTDEIIFKLLIPFVLSAGFLGNLVFLFTVARLHRMHTITNLYLSHLSVADILFLGLSCGAYTATYLNSPISHDTWIPSSFGCALVFFGIYLSYFASVEIVTIVSLERYFAICNPMRHRAMNGKSRTWKILACLWFSAVIFAVLSAPRFGQLKKGCLAWPDTDKFRHLPSHFHDCFKVNREWFLLSEAIQGLAFVISFALSLFTYINIILTLDNRQIIGDSQQDSVAKQTRGVRNQVAKMLIVNGVVFFICQTPFRAVSVNSILKELEGEDILNKDGFGALLLVVGRGLLFLNSAINPYLYALSSKFYRRAFRQALCAGKATRRESMMLTVSSSIRNSTHEVSSR